VSQELKLLSKNRMNQQRRTDDVRSRGVGF
jgi:hypothetical protein